MVIARRCRKAFSNTPSENALWAVCSPPPSCTTTGGPSSRRSSALISAVLGDFPFDCEFSMAFTEVRKEAARLRGPGQRAHTGAGSDPRRPREPATTGLQLHRDDQPAQ